MINDSSPFEIAAHQDDISKLYGLVRPNNAKPSSRKANLAEQKSVPEGGRHSFLRSVAVQLRKKGLDRDEILGALAVINQQRCQPPKPQSAVEELADWATTLEIQKPGATVSTSGWQGALIRNSDGSPKPLLANAITALRLAPEFSGVLGFNEFSFGVTMLSPAPWAEANGGMEWTDHEDRLTTDWLQRNGIYVPLEIAGQAIQVVAKDRAFHPVREFLESLKWDGTRRIDGWLSSYLGVEANAYTAAVGARWLISGVARIYKPGAKADHCLILEGPQGLGKSTSLRVLAGDWFTDEIADLGTKDAAMQTHGVWIIEMSELASVRGAADVGADQGVHEPLHRQISSPYGKRLVELPRQCVFAGTVNHSTYLRDETGGRRFWPVVCTRIWINELRRDRDQLWAEAVARFKARDKWWLDTAELNQFAASEQRDRYEGDPWEELIAGWVLDPKPLCEGENPFSGECPPIKPFSSTRDSVSIDDVLRHCIGKPKEQWNQGDKSLVARVLMSLGYDRYRASAGAGETRPWRYRRVSPQ